MNSMVRIGIISIVLALSACSSDSDNTEDADTTGTTDTTDSTDTTDTTDTINSIDGIDGSDVIETIETPDMPLITGQSPLQVLGTWVDSCHEDTGLPDGFETQFREITVTFTGGMTGTYTSTAFSYSSADCSTTPLASVSDTLEGTYTIGDSIISADGLEVNEIDLFLESITGFDGEVVSPILDRPLTLSIFAIINDQLFLGIDEEFESETPVRATQLDFETPFVRQ